MATASSITDFTGGISETSRTSLQPSHISFISDIDDRCCASAHFFGCLLFHNVTSRMCVCMDVFFGMMLNFFKCEIVNSNSNISHWSYNPIFPFTSCNISIKPIPLLLFRFRLREDFPPSEANPGNVGHTTHLPPKHNQRSSQVASWIVLSCLASAVIMPQLEATRRDE